jgi:isoleucyl-tRNA synthetase
LSRFFVQNATFDEFSPRKYTLGWAFEASRLLPPDLWLLSKLQEITEDYTSKLERCEFNAAVAALDDFVIETLSRLYVPMIRKELWTDELKTLERRQTIYALLHHTLKTVTLLFNPITPYLSEALYQKVYRQLEPELPESVNFASWPMTNEKIRDKTLEEQFELLLKTVSIAYAARQQGKLKRRWPLKKAVVVAPEKTLKALQCLEALFLELTNVKDAEFTVQTPEYIGGENWVSSREGDVTVFISGQRDETLLGEGFMRDLARRVQALRKELGFVPTDVLESVHIAELEPENMNLLEPYLNEMAELVRARKVYLHSSRNEVEAQWYESELDGKKIYLNVH